MKVLITGGFGFIGSHLAQYFLTCGYSVTVLDNLSTTSIEQASKILDIHHPQLHFFRIDLAFPNVQDREIIEQSVKDCDLAYHLASSVGVKHIDHNPKGSIHNNSNLTVNLFPLFEKYLKKMIFASTSEVYGESENAKEDDVLQIGCPDVLRWGYACGKLMSEFLLRSYNFPYVIARIFNVTGRGQSAQHGMVLPTFIEKVSKGQDIIIYGDGNQFRSFCDVRDAVEMLAILGQDEIHCGEIYNIGNPEGTISINDLAKLVMEQNRSLVTIKHLPYKEAFSPNSGDIIRRKPNTEKMQKFYFPQYSLKETIQEMLK